MLHDKRSFVRVRRWFHWKTQDGGKEERKKIFPFGLISSGSYGMARKISWKTLSGLEAHSSLLGYGKNLLGHFDGHGKN